MDAMDVLRLIVAEHNRWMDAELDRLVIEHAELTAQVLPRMPKVMLVEAPLRDEAHLMKALELMREDERLALKRAGVRRPRTGSQIAKGSRRTP